MYNTEIPIRYRLFGFIPFSRYYSKTWTSGSARVRDQPLPLSCFVSRWRPLLAKNQPLTHEPTVRQQGNSAQAEFQRIAPDGRNVVGEITCDNEFSQRGDRADEVESDRDDREAFSRTEDMVHAELRDPFENTD